MSDQNKGNQSSNGGSGENPDLTKNQSPAEGDKGNISEYEKNQKIREEKARKLAEEAESKLKSLREEAEKLEETLANTTKNSSGSLSEDEINDLAKEHDVDPSLIKSLLAIQSKTLKQTEKLIDDKVGALKQDESKKALRNQFTSDLTSALSSEYDGLDLSDDAKAAIELHYFTKLKANPDYTVSEALDTLYAPLKTGKHTAEDESKGDKGSGSESIDFREATQDPKQIAEIMKDPKKKSAYYDWRRKHNI